MSAATIQPAAAALKSAPEGDGGTSPSPPPVTSKAEMLRTLNRWLNEGVDAARAQEAKAAVRKAKADPVGNKLTPYFDVGGTSYAYWSAGTDGRGRAVRFCRSCQRNAAGYYLGWREVVGNAGTKRDGWTARKVKARLSELMKRRSDAFKAKRAPR